MAGDSAGEVEFWHDAITETLPGDAFSDTEVIKEPAGWKKEHPPQDMIRVPGVVHETSMLYMSDNLETDKTASVDQNYRPRGCNNVYVTGGALFPSSGSWNRESTIRLPAQVRMLTIGLSNLDDVWICSRSRQKATQKEARRGKGSGGPGALKKTLMADPTKGDKNIQG